MLEPPPDPAFRWQTFFQHAAEPVFLLSGRHRLLFANRAWEACTGLTFRDVRGQSARRAAAEDERSRAALVLAALAPPREALRGEPAHVRRRAPHPTAPVTWWEISFFPLAGPDQPLGVLGRIRPVTPQGQALFSLPEKLVALQTASAARYRLEEIGGDTPGMRRVREQARLAAHVRHPVLLTGGPGTGKEWLARSIHQAGPDRARYFARVDGARLPAAVLDELLFSPRGPSLSLGTVYLREPASLPRETQARLARWLTAADPAAPRLLVGMRSDASGEVRAGRLLDEFYCRFSTLGVALPPLRERADELPRLVEVLLARAARALSQDVRTPSPEALQLLQAHAWPGNLSELYQVLLDAARPATGPRVEAADLPFHLRHGPLPAERKLPLDELLEQAERRLIELALRLTRNHRGRAAELLGIWQTRLGRRMKHFGLLAPGEAAGDE